MAKGSVELVTTAIILTIVIVIIRFARREPLIYIKKESSARCTVHAEIKINTHGETP